MATQYSGPTLGEVHASFPLPSLDLPWSSLHRLLIPGAVIALVGFAEAGAISRAMAARTRKPWDADREFVSQGAANLAAGLFGGLPVGGSFSRSALNYASGARTQRAAVVSGVAILTILPATRWLSELPIAVLAAVVVSSVVSLVDIR